MVPGSMAGEWVIWMYSVESETHAAKTNPPKGELTQTYPPTYNLSRFRAFLQSDIKLATENPSIVNNLLPSTSSTSACPLDPLIIPIALTPSNTLLAYSLTREAVMKLRSARAWIYDETKQHKVTLNLAHVRTIFYGTTTVKRLILPLHPDKRTSTPTTDPNYKMAFNFLTEIALSACTPNAKGEYLNTIPVICHDDYSGDLKPKTSDNKRPKTIPLGQTPFSWPDMNPKKRKSPQHEPNQQPGPANPVPVPEQSKKRPNTPHPWEFCNNCWEFGKHYSDVCTTKPIQRPPDFETKRANLRKMHSADHKRNKRKNQAVEKRPGERATEGHP
jgi:hypothetical protein